MTESKDFEQFMLGVNFINKNVKVLYFDMIFDVALDQDPLVEFVTRLRAFGWEVKGRQVRFIAGEDPCKKVRD